MIRPAPPCCCCPGGGPSKADCSPRGRMQHGRRRRRRWHQPHADAPGAQRGGRRNERCEIVQQEHSSLWALLWIMFGSRLDCAAPASTEQSLAQARRLLSQLLHLLEAATPAGARSGPDSPSSTIRFFPAAVVQAEPRARRQVSRSPRQMSFTSWSWRSSPPTGALWRLGQSSRRATVAFHGGPVSVLVD